MYVVAECGTRMTIPLYDVETADIQIKDCANDRYVDLEADSEFGWSAGPATNINWQDCTGSDPRWNNVTTTVYFYGSPNVCGVYRVEFRDWGGNIWSLFANCTGTNDPGFYIYDNYPEASTSFRLLPELSISDIGVTGVCPDFQVSFSVTNTGCVETDAPVCIKSDLPGGPWNSVIPNISPGETKSTTMNITVGACPMGDHQIIAGVDCNDVIPECSEVGGSAVACDIPGGNSIAIKFPIVILNPPSPTPTNTPTNTPTRTPTNTPTNTPTPTPTPTSTVCVIYAGVYNHEDTSDISYWRGLNLNEYMIYNAVLNADPYTRFSSIVISDLSPGTLSSLDVLVLPDNAVPDTYLGAVTSWFGPRKVIVGIDSAVCFLAYSGLIWPATAGTNGWPTGFPPTYWDYSSSAVDQRISVNECTTIDYHLNEIIDSSDANARLYSDQLPGDFVGVTVKDSDPYYVYAGYRDVPSSGRLVFLGPFNFPTGHLYDLIREAAACSLDCPRTP
jgi:hypothetical protein